MADYTIFTPENLSGLDPEVPTSAEDSAKLQEAILQTRAILRAVFLKEHNADGTHKSVAERLDSGSITGDKIKSSSSNDSERAIGTDHIKDKSITPDKLADFPLSGSLLQARSVAGDKIADRTIQGSNIALKGVQSENMADKAITGDKVADSTLGGEKLKDDSIQGKKLEDATLEATKFLIPAGLLPLGGSGNQGAACEIGGQLELSTIDTSEDPPVAVFKIRSAGDGTLLPIAVIREVGSDGGLPIASTWNVRPLSGTSQFAKQFDPTDMLVMTGPKTFYFAEKGTYLVYIAAVAYRSNLHQVRLRNVTQNETALVGLLVDADITAKGQMPSTGFGIVRVKSDAESFQLQHWVRTVDAGPPPTSLGYVPASNGEDQTFASIVAIKLS